MVDIIVLGSFRSEGAKFDIKSGWELEWDGGAVALSSTSDLTQIL